MSVLAHEAPGRPDHASSARIGHPARQLLGLAIVALSVYLCAIVSLWFLPLAPVLAGAVWPGSARRIRTANRPVRVLSAEVPTLGYAGQR